MLTWWVKRKAWMTSLLFEDWLKKFNIKMQHQKRHILLFIDNAPSHPNIKLSNITLAFFPPNTTSMLQPMDQGIIQSMKLKFRKLQLRKIVSLMERDKSKTSTAFFKDLDILQTILWIKESWNAVLPQTIVKCFRASGFEMENTPSKCKNFH